MGEVCVVIGDVSVDVGVERRLGGEESWSRCCAVIRGPMAFVWR